jgi:2,4-dienoyl-CoA reductase (NADPH2)
VLLNESPSAEKLRAFDEVVFATGIHPRRPDIPGIGHPRVVSYVDVLSGKVQPGRDVAIIGMGGIGFDVALYLLERGSRATLDTQAFAAHWAFSFEGKLFNIEGKTPAHRITMVKRSTGPFGHTLGRTTGWVHRAELARNGVRMMKGVEYRRIDDAGLHLHVDGKDVIVEADTIVVCAGQVPNRPEEPNEKNGVRPHFIGGAREAGELDAERAMREGAELAAAL